MGRSGWMEQFDVIAARFFESLKNPHQEVCNG